MEKQTVERRSEWNVEREGQETELKEIIPYAFHTWFLWLMRSEHMWFGEIEVPGIGAIQIEMNAHCCKGGLHCLRPACQDSVWNYKEMCVNAVRVVGCILDVLLAPPQNDMLVISDYLNSMLLYSRVSKYIVLELYGIFIYKWTRLYLFSWVDSFDSPFGLWMYY